MTNAVIFAVEPFTRAFAEADGLMQLHWEEIAKNKQLLKLNPNVKQYEAISENLLMVTARHEGDLVGYFLWLLTIHPHYMHVRVAEEDLHFLLPEFRRGLTGYKFLKAACQAAMENGAQLLIVREKVGHEHLALMQRLGFRSTDIVYTRVIGGS